MSRISATMAQSDPSSPSVQEMVGRWEQIPAWQGDRPQDLNAKATRRGTYAQVPPATSTTGYEAPESYRSDFNNQMLEGFITYLREEVPPSQVQVPTQLVPQVDTSVASGHVRTGRPFQTTLEEAGTGGAIGQLPPTRPLASPTTHSASRFSRPPPATSDHVGAPTRSPLDTVAPTYIPSTQSPFKQDGLVSVLCNQTPVHPPISAANTTVREVSFRPISSLPPPTLISTRPLPPAAAESNDYDSVFSDYTDFTDFSEDTVLDRVEERYSPYVPTNTRRPPAVRPRQPLHSTPADPGQMPWQYLPVSDIPRPATALAGNQCDINNRPTLEPSGEPSTRPLPPPPGFKPRHPRRPPPTPQGCENCSRRDLNAESRRKPRQSRRSSTTNLPENTPKLPPVAPRRPQKLQLKSSQPSDSETPCPPTTTGDTTAPSSARSTESPPTVSKSKTKPSELDLQLERLKSEAEALGLTDQMAKATYIVGGLRPQTSTTPGQPRVKGPPLRNDKWMKEESWELFIHRFERLARDLDWDENIKLLQLVSCLSGKSLEIYRRTDEEKECTYRELKRELGLAFALTPEEVGKNFTGAYLEKEENCEQFTNNLEEKFKRWFRKANPDKPLTAEALINHCVREQLVKSLPVAIRQEILQEDMVDAHEIARYAVRYFQARKNTGDKASTAPVKTENAPAASGKKKQWSKKQKDKQPAKISAASGQKKRYHCDQCQTDEHWYYKCPKSHAAATAASSAQDISATQQVTSPSTKKKNASPTKPTVTVQDEAVGQQETETQKKKKKLQFFNDL